MKLIVEEPDYWAIENMVVMHGYNGICDKCGTPVEYDKNFAAVKGRETERATYFVPLKIFFCPECRAKVDIIRVYKNLDVTADFKSTDVTEGFRSMVKK